jgi:phage FluMu protein Com
MEILRDRYKRAFVEVICPKCKQAKIICLPEEEIPQCEFCKIRMVLKEVLTEGKY